MNKQTSLVGLFLLGLLAGCTSDWDPQRRSAAGGSSQAASQATDHTGSAPGRSSPAAFAALPDRGELLAYDRSRAVRHQGAYTSHPVDLSEAHAFRASHAGGELVVAAPDGEMIRIGYERHIEHPDGNWSWIGRTADGADAVLTFGEKAVFGTIPNRGQETLRVTTMAGGAWLVAIDRSKLPRDINRATTRNGKPDYLVPPGLAASLATSASDMAMSAADVSPAAVSNTIDVVLGYTNGYATARGGASQAVTRLNNLVVVANQAMTNSLVTRRLRLVRTVQVSYPDATENRTALEELTGYREGDIPVPAALQPLRNARDQYGGDLVSLVRAFRTPENDGCGIAWLIGAGQTAFNTAAAPFGYSVVSDGTDRDEGDGNNYFCRDESLAHELGHNMGQAHNSQDSGGQAGVHAYSYGYHETSATGFFTVMAYALADSDQIPIRHFANPAVTYAGRPTGVANASDNTRSLNLTMPVVINFRAAVVAAGTSARNDVDGDGRSDLLFHNASTRQLSYRIMSGTSTVRSGLINGVGAGYTVGATGDLNADGKVDLIWTSAARDLYLWAGNGTGFTSFRIGDYPAGWVLVGAGDVDGDGRSDLLFHNAGTRQFSYRIMQGTSTVRSALINGVGAGYSVGATGDLNGDGKLDLIWTSAARDLYLWAGNGTGFTSFNIGGYPAGWAFSGAGDVDGNGKSDLFFRNPSTREFSYRIMNGTSVVRSALISNTGAGYRIASSGDLNGDAKLDIVWTSNALDLFLWTGNGNTFAGAAAGIYPSGWTVIR